MGYLAFLCSVGRSFYSPLLSFLQTDFSRMSVMSLGPQDSYVRVLRELVPFKIILTKTSAALWKKSPYLRSPNPSA